MAIHYLAIKVKEQAKAVLVFIFLDPGDTFLQKSCEQQIVGKCENILYDSNCPPFVVQNFFAKKF